MKKIGKKFNRREFMKTSTLGAASLGLWGRPRNASSQPPFAPEPQGSQKTVIQRELGRTGIRIPVVNMGVMNAFNGELVKKSYDIGVRYFDTAAWYMRGFNEEMVGRALKELGVRNDVVIGTKVYFPHPQRNLSDTELRDKFLEIANQSLIRLQTDHVDILFLHEVRTLPYLNRPGIMEALSKLKQEGKTRAIGFSTHTHMNELIGEATKGGFYDVVETAFNYAMKDDRTYTATLKKAAEKGIGLIAMKTQCTQYWYREFVPHEGASYYEGKILHTAVLKWVLRHPFITTAIPGYTTFQQMEEDFSVAHGLSYTPEEAQFLSDRGVIDKLAYCRQCHRCVDSCPREVQIPSLMRAHLYATCYPNVAQARDALAEPPTAKGIDACRTCRDCLAVCRNGIDIARRIDELRLMFA